MRRAPISRDVFPVTPEGRLAAAVLMILGITLFAAITGTITSYIVARHRQEGVPETMDVPRLIRELGALRAEGLVSDDEFESKKAELLKGL